jgi:hypothetical protein
MALTFRSSIPETFTLTGVDTTGRKRTVTATRESGEFYWDMTLRHPSGQTWPARFHGPNVLDAMSELMTSRDAEFKQDGARGDRPPAQMPDHNRPVNDGLAHAPIIPAPPKW